MIDRDVPEFRPAHAQGEEELVGLTASQVDLRDRVVETLQTIYDPEIPVNIFELGLIYYVDVLPLGRVNIRMTLTSPHCPVAESLPLEVEQKVKTIDGVEDSSVELVWEPSWSPECMTEEARLELNLL